MEQAFALTVNGRQVNVATDGDRPLLDVLREDLQLTGTKYGCGEGECGACTVLIDGQPARSCITTVAEAERQDIQTIESLSADGTLHPVQQAFIEKQAVQCGYCVPGQIMNAVGLLRANPQPNREQIVAEMSGNICRCCNYRNILAAVERACELSRHSVVSGSNVGEPKAAD